MHYINYILRLLIFLLSNFGYWEFLRKKTKVHIYFLPALTVALQVSMLYFAGLFHILREVSLLLLLGGILLLLFQLRKPDFLKHYKNAGYLFLALSMVVLLFYVKGKSLATYDNFSHWGLVVKQMLMTNRYPNFMDHLIGFTEYPLGSATYIYYAASFIGMGESVWMLAQAYMILVSLVPLFILCKRNRTVSCMFMFFVSNFIFIYNIRIMDLPVDTLLPMVSMSALFYIYIYGGGREGCQGNKRELYLAVPFLVQILQIKNSGIFFTAIATVWILAGIRKDKQAWARVITAFAPYLTLILWHKHCSYVFDHSAVSKHAMTVQNYKAIFGGKTMEDIKSISWGVLKFSFTWKDVWLFFLCLAVVGIVAYAAFKNCRSTFRRLFAFCVAMYISYQVGTLFMYLFSMPGEEALKLAGIGRYGRTILLAVFYCTVLLCMKLISEMQLKQMRSVISLLSLVAVVAVCQIGAKGRISTIFSDVSVSVQRDWLEEVRLKYAIPSGDSYCILVGEKDDAGYITYMARYLFQSENISVLPWSEMTDESVMEDSRYILVYDGDNPDIREYMEKNYPAQAGSEVIIRE